MKVIHLRIIIAAFSFMVTPHVFANIYKCEGIDGSISYQESSCDHTQQRSLPITVEARERDKGDTTHSGQETHVGRSAGSHENFIMPIIKQFPNNALAYLNSNSTIIIFMFSAALVALSIRLLKRKPKEQDFTCFRCNRLTPHSPRTIDAWRNGKSEFFCQECHSKWLRSQPRGNSRSRSESNSGCLGVVIIFAVIPLALLFI